MVRLGHWFSVGAGLAKAALAGKVNEQQALGLDLRDPPGSGAPIFATGAALALPEATNTLDGAGRFLDAAAPAPGTATVVLDFNLAYNPPCAFTPYATCPLPPPHNVLPVPVPAGEMDPGGH